MHDDNYDTELPVLRLPYIERIDHLTMELNAVGGPSTGSHCLSDPSDGPSFSTSRRQLTPVLTSSSDTPHCYFRPLT